MTIKEKAKEYSKYFESKTRADGTNYVVLIDDSPEELRESVGDAHGDRFADDFIFGTYADLMQNIGDYEVDTANDLEGIRGEIVDNYVSVYTSDLTAWLNSSNHNAYYLTQASEYCESKDGFELLSMAQYLAIDEVMSEVVSLLDSD